MHHLHVCIHGRVQGVGFRHFALREANALGLRGRVANLPDGSVEVEAEGEPAVLERFIEILRHGPPGARVTDLHAAWSEGSGRFHSFRIGG